MKSLDVLSNIKVLAMQDSQPAGHLSDQLELARWTNMTNNTNPYK